jgi:hypothetical protein
MRTTYRIPTVPSGGSENQVARLPVKATSSLKTILLVAGLALVTATPSLAQSYDPSIGTGNIVPYYGQAPQGGVDQDARNAYARIVPRGSRGARNAYARSVPGAAAFQSWNFSNEQGNAVRADPDPNIRFQLHRESLQGRW